jgi:serine/threonine-protein kinase
MGEVWAARHRLLQRRSAAVKLMRRRFRYRVGDSGARRAHASFLREVDAISALRSPHTVELYDFGVTDDDCYYYVMEQLDGLDLEGLTRRHGPLPAERVIYLMQQICSSLAEAHRRGLVHGDVKPANLFACCLGESYDFVKVLDFGLVKWDGRLDPGEEITLDDMVPGTPAYMPPEMAMGARLADGRSDSYALGCVGYFLLTATTVFPAASPVGTIVEHVRKTPEPPSSRTAMPIPAALDRIILTCLEKEAEDRFQAAENLAAALASVRFRDPWDNRRAADWWHRNEPEIAGPAERIALTTERSRHCSPCAAPIRLSSWNLRARRRA